jgi:hypothetical protein
MKLPALAIATLHSCAIFGAAGQPIYSNSDDEVSTSVQLLRGGVVVGGHDDVLSTITDVSDEEKEDSDAIAAIVKRTTRRRVQTFHLKENITLTLSSAEVDKNFCDPSSPLSLAGYMNGEIDV